VGGRRGGVVCSTAGLRAATGELRLRLRERKTNASRLRHRGSCEHPGESENRHSAGPTQAGVFWLNNASQRGAFCLRKKGTGAAWLNIYESVERKN